MLEVTVTCGWCLTKVKTELSDPVPEGWKTVEVTSPKPWLKPVSETFCGSGCVDKYQSAATDAHAAAGADYETCFYGRMNDARKKSK